MKDGIAGLLNSVYSWRRSYVIVYNNLNGFDNHAMCGSSDNVVKLHFQDNRRSVVYGLLDIDSSFN